MADAATVETQVLVVGAGPAGLVAGITLARYGIDVLVVEKRNTTSTLSRALVVSTRSMELLRAWGLEDDVRAGAAEVEPRAWVTPNLASGEGTEMPLGYPTAAEAAKVSPSRPAWAPQDHVEPLMLALLRAAPSAKVQFGCELVSLGQDDNAVHAVLRDRESGRSRRVEALFAVGADGSHSRVRDQLGIRMEGPDNLAEFHRVEFRAPLAEVVGERRYGLYVITDPRAAGVLAPRGRGDRWSLSREWTPGQSRLVDYGEEQLVELIAAAAGVAALQPDVERLSTFSFAAQIAERYRAGGGFVVGDAAHRMTPRGGTGMNTAIQDAYDLGWKLAWVLRGWADASILDSYESERRRVGLHNVHRAGDRDGARRDAEEALPWDLNRRLAHHWLRREDHAMSTLDLLGEGLTLLAAPGDPRWADAATAMSARAPVVIETLDASTARALGLELGGAMLVRPDAQPLSTWTNFAASFDGNPIEYLQLARGRPGEDRRKHPDKCPN